MWKDSNINYRHVLEIKKLIETAGDIGINRYSDKYVANIRDYWHWKEMQSFDL